MIGKHVVVEGAGCDDEKIVFETIFFYDGCDYKEKNYSPEEAESLNVDIMFKDENGNITTEF